MCTAIQYREDSGIESSCSSKLLHIKLIRRDVQKTTHRDFTKQIMPGVVYTLIN